MTHDPANRDRASHAPAATPTLRTTIRQLHSLHGSAAVPLFVLSAIGIGAGILEAAALTLFIRGALTIASDDVDNLRVLGVTIGSDTTVLFALGAVFVLGTIGGHVYMARGSARLSLNVLTNARTRLIDGFMNADWELQSAKREGELQEATSTLASRASTAATHLLMGVSAMSILIAIVISAIAIAPIVSLTVVAALIPVVLLLQPLTRATRRRSQETVQKAGGFAEAVASTTSLAREYRTFGVAYERSAQLRSLADSTSLSTVRARTGNMLASYLFKDLALLAFIGIVGVLNVVVDLRASATTAAVLLIIRALGYAQLTYNVVQVGAEESGAVTALLHEIATLENAREAPGTIPIDSVGAIAFRDVHFNYVGDRPALAGVSLEIGVGDSVGLVGPSGAGKTTIAELLLGLRTPSDGAITVDGVNLTDIRRTDWNRLVAFVPQDPRLSQQSIADNIRFCRDGITDQRIREAAGQAHIADAIGSLPHQFDTVLGPRSSGLSGGQRQRLAIARALAGDPQLLVLDEPTSALDNESEELFRQTLNELRGSVTMIVIAHRLTTLESCDTIVTVRDGRIVKTHTG